MVGMWGMLYCTGQIVELATKPVEISFHLVSELATAVLLIVGGYALLTGKSMGRPLVVPIDGDAPLLAAQCQRILHTDGGRADDDHVLRPDGHEHGGVIGLARSGRLEPCMAAPHCAQVEAEPVRHGGRRLQGETLVMLLGRIANLYQRCRASGPSPWAARAAGVRRSAVRL